MENSLKLIKEELKKKGYTGFILKNFAQFIKQVKGTDGYYRLIIKSDNIIEYTYNFVGYNPHSIPIPKDLKSLVERLTKLLDKK